MQELLYDSEWQKFSQWLGIYKKREAKIPAKVSNHSTNYMVFSDLHIPFHDQEAISYAVEKGKRMKVDTLIVAGDAVDCYSLSRFAKFQTVSIQEEFLQARKFFDYASRCFNKVIVLCGNHEQRERKHFSNRLPTDELEWLLNKPMLQRCTEDMPNVELFHNKIQGVDMNWFMPLGDIVIGHPEKSSVNHFVPVETFRKWISMWGCSLGINPVPRLIIIGHTHQAGISWSGETMLVENGCLCKFQEYSLQPNLYPKPQRLAFTVFSMVDNKVEINSVKQYYPFVEGRHDKKSKAKEATQD